MWYLIINFVTTYSQDEAIPGALLIQLDQHALETGTLEYAIDDSGKRNINITTLTEMQQSIKHIQDVRALVKYNELDAAFYDTEDGYIFWKQSSTGRLAGFTHEMERHFVQHWFGIEQAFINDDDDCRMQLTDYFITNDNNTGMMDELTKIMARDEDDRLKVAWGIKLAVDHVRVTTTTVTNNDERMTQFMQLASFAIGYLMYSQIVIEDDPVLSVSPLQVLIRGISPEWAATYEVLDMSRRLALTCGTMVGFAGERL